jgi:hypothetical protein
MEEDDSREHLITKTGSSDGNGGNGINKKVEVAMNKSIGGVLSSMRAESIGSWYTHQRLSISTLISDIRADRFFYAIIIVVAFVQGNSSHLPSSSPHLLCSCAVTVAQPFHSHSSPKGAGLIE